MSSAWCVPIMAPPSCLRRWWGWVVVTLVAVQFALTLGPVFNYSMLLLSFQEEFHTSTAVTGWVGSIALGLISLACVVPLALLRRLKPRTVVALGVVLYCGGVFATAFVPSLGYAFLTYSLAVGLGMSFVFQASIILCLTWFPTKYCARAQNLLTLGTPIGTLVSAPALNALISSHGWRRTFMVFSGGVFVVCAPTALLLTVPAAPSQPQEPGEKDDETDAAAATHEKLTGQPSPDDEGVEVVIVPARTHTPFYRRCDPWLWCASICAGSLASSFITINLASFMDSIDLSRDNISLAIVIVSIGEIVGKTLMFLFGDALPFRQFYIIIASYVIGGIVSGFLTLISTFGPMIALAFFMGVSKGWLYAMVIPATMELFHKYGVSTVSILAMVPFGIGVLVNAPLSGGLYDLSGDYTLSLLVLVALLTFSTGCMLLIPIKQNIRSWRMRNAHTRIEMQDDQYAPTETNENVTAVEDN